MSAGNFQTYYDFIEAKDNDGQPFHITEGDPGGATVYGWTEAMWVSVAPLHGVTDVSLANFKAQTKLTLEPLTRAEYWNRVQADHLPSGVDLFWADFQFGSGGASRVLQGVLGVTADGCVGPETVAAARAVADQDGLLARMLTARTGYYDACGFRDRWPGLYRRAQRSHDLATTLVGTLAAGATITPGQIGTLKSARALLDDTIAALAPA